MSEELEIKKEEKEELKEKTDALIKLAEGESEVVEEKKLPVDEPEVRKRGVGVGVKILLAVLGVIVILIGALVGTGCGVLSCATVDNMPEAPAASEMDTTEFILGAVTEVIKENTITLTPEFINNLLIKVKEQVNASTDLIRIDDLFCEMSDGSGVIYARVYIGTVNVKGFSININKVIPVQAAFNVDFDNETKEIVAQIGEITCGKIDLPDALIDTVLAQIELPENVTVDAEGNIRYNTAELDAMIDKAVGEAIASSVEGTLGGLLSSFATELINVDLTDAEIIDDNLVISGSVF